MAISNHSFDEWPAFLERAHLAFEMWW